MRFSKQKVAEAQEKKARSGLVSGLLARKRLKVGDASKNDPVVTPPFAHSLAKRPTSPTSSLELIASTKEGTKKKKVASKPFLPNFWDDADAAALKAHEALLSHIHKLMQVYFDNVGYHFWFRIFPFALF